MVRELYQRKNLESVCWKHKSRLRPDLVLLGPDEHFTVLSISGGRPKKSGALKSLALLLGPDFMTDIITVETSDHARLQVRHPDFELGP